MYAQTDHRRVTATHKGVWQWHDIRESVTYITTVTAICHRPVRTREFPHKWKRERRVVCVRDCKERCSKYRYYSLKIDDWYLVIGDSCSSIFSNLTFRQYAAPVFYTSITFYFTLSANHAKWTSNRMAMQFLMHPSIAWSIKNIFSFALCCLILMYCLIFFSSSLLRSFWCLPCFFHFLLLVFTHVPLPADCRYLLSLRPSPIPQINRSNKVIKPFIKRK